MALPKHGSFRLVTSPQELHAALVEVAVNKKTPPPIRALDVPASYPCLVQFHDIIDNTAVACSVVTVKEATALLRAAGVPIGEVPMLQYTKP